MYGPYAVQTRRAPVARPVPFTPTEPPPAPPGIPFRYTGPPVGVLTDGQPWEHGDSYPHRGTLVSADAPTSPQGVASEERYDARDFSVLCVYDSGTHEVVELPVGYHAERTTVVSKEQAEHVVADSNGARNGSRCPAAYALWTEEGERRTRERGAWHLEVRANA